MPVDLDFLEPLPALTSLNFGSEYTPPVALRRLAWQGAARWGALVQMCPQTDLIFDNPAPTSSRQTIPWGPPFDVKTAMSARWRDKTPRQRGSWFPWGSMTAILVAPDSAWNYVPPVHQVESLPWDRLFFYAAAASFGYRYPARKHLARAIPWSQVGRRNRHPLLSPWGRLNRRLKRCIIPWDQGRRPTLIWPPPEPPPYITPVIPSPCDYQPVAGQANFDFTGDDLLPASTFFEFWCHAPARPIVNRTLIMLPTASIVKLPGREPIEAGNIGLDLDIDSWAWSLRATVPAASLAMIQPDGNGPAEIEINLSGHIWTMLVEGFEESREFGSAAYTVHGRSTAAYLAAPYAPARTWTQNAERTSRQLADEELINTGWTLDWNTTDWLVPGGVFSYDSLTPLDAIGRIAASVGSVILPHASAKTLTIQPRYRFNVWNLDLAASNAVLDPSILTGISLQWSPSPKYNGVYTSGQSQGVVVFAKRAGTSGNLLAQQAVDALITTPQAGLERGRQALNAAGNKSRVSVSLPLTNSGTLPGLVQPGDVCEVNEPTPWKGIVTAVSITAEMDENGPAFKQQIEIERHYE